MRSFILFVSIQSWAGQQISWLNEHRTRCKLRKSAFSSSCFFSLNFFFMLLLPTHSRRCRWREKLLRRLNSSESWSVKKKIVFRSERWLVVGALPPFHCLDECPANTMMLLMMILKLCMETQRRRIATAAACCCCCCSANQREKMWEWEMRTLNDW